MSIIADAQMEYQKFRNDRDAVKTGDLQLIALCDPKIVCDHAINSGDYNVLCRVLNAGYKPSEDSVYNAIAGGNFAMLKKIIEHGAVACSCDYEIAIRKANMEIFEYLISTGVQITDEEPFRVAAIKENITIMERLLNVGAPWNYKVFEYAARLGKQQALEWLIKNGCPQKPVDKVYW